MTEPVHVLILINVLKPDLPGNKYIKTLKAQLLETLRVVWKFPVRRVAQCWIANVSACLDFREIVCNL